jgi:hypothetical protein
MKIEQEPSSINAAATILSIQTQSKAHSLSARYLRIQKALIMTTKLFALLENDLLGGGEWSIGPQSLIGTSQSLIKKGQENFAQSKQAAKDAAACAAKCHTIDDAVCDQCETTHLTASLDTLTSSSVQLLTSSHTSFVQAKVAIEATLQQLLGANPRALGDIITLAKKSAASTCVELNKWISILIDIALNVPTTIDPAAASPTATQSVLKNNKLTKEALEERKQQLRDSSALRGVSEETRKELEATKARVKLIKEKPKDSTQCQDLNHCDDPLWPKTEMVKDGCVHGCSVEIQSVAFDPPEEGKCTKLCTHVMNELLGTDTTEEDKHDFLQGCEHSCSGTLDNGTVHGVVYCLRPKFVAISVALASYFYNHLVHCLFVLLSRPSKTAESSSVASRSIG